MLPDQYADHIVQAVRSIREGRRQTVSRCAELVCRPLGQDGPIYVFGCGHSRILVAGAEVPARLSGNIPGGAERNRTLIEQFQPRIRHL